MSLSSACILGRHPAEVAVVHASLRPLLSGHSLSSLVPAAGLDDRAAMRPCACRRLRTGRQRLLLHGRLLRRALAHLAGLLRDGHRRCGGRARGRGHRGACGRRHPLPALARRIADIARRSQGPARTCVCDTEYRGGRFSGCALLRYGDVADLARSVAQRLIASRIS